MSKLDDLIQKLCPDGVEYKSIPELFHTRNGYTPSKSKKEYWENGTIPWFRMEDIRENGRILSEALQYVSESAVKGTPFPANSIIVATSATIGEHALIKVPSLANQRFTYLMLKEEYNDYIDIMFVYYYCFKLDEYCKICLNQGNFASVDMKKFFQFKFPIPPLEVQREIVRMLDSFTLLIDELTTELTARKKQYEFYRDSLLTFKGDTKKYVLGDIATVTKLAGFEFTNYVTYSDEGNIIALRGLNVKNGKLSLEDVKYIDKSDLSKLSRSKLHVGDMLFTYVGTIGQVALIDEEDKYYLAPNVALIRCDQSVMMPEYMRYYFQSNQFWDKQINRLLQSSSMKNIPMEKIRKFEIAVPSMEIQRRLVKVLDNFDVICTDLNIGLPAEIEARQKQYEYYRDLLLTFAETEKIVGGGYNGNVINIIQYVFGYVTIPMGSLFDFRNGLSKGKDFFGKGIPFIRYTDVYNNRFLRESDVTALVECTSAEIEKLGVHRGDVLFTRTSETAEDVGWSSVMLDDIGDCVFNGFTIKATPKTEYLLPEYCAFCFATEDFRQYVTSHCAFTTRASLTGKTITEYQLAFPSVEKQQEIVDVLNKFHILCNDLSTGLPAEIEARQKQYEYYRDKLLSFKELQK